MVFDKLYNELIAQKKTLNVSYNYAYKDIDRGLIEKLGPSGQNAVGHTLIFKTAAKWFYVSLFIYVFNKCSFPRFYAVSFSVVLFS
jgi:hypothetical protein